MSILKEHYYFFYRIKKIFMKTTKPIYYVCCFSLLVLLSCNKQLNVLPTTQQVDGNIIKDSKGALTVLNGIYYQFANAGFDGNNNPSIEWCDYQEVNPSMLSGMVDYFADTRDLAAHTYTPSNTGSAMWNYYYKIVNAANGFLKNLEPVDNISSESKKQMIAEALFLRAYANTNLLLYYAQYDTSNSPYGVVLREEITTSNNIPKKRSTVAETYQSILQDIDSAIAGLPNRNTQPFYTNVWAAKLLKARLLINRGTQDDYNTVISLCKDIIAHGGFQLESSVKNIFLSAGLNSKEVILGVQPYLNDVYKFNSYLFYFNATATPFMLNLFNNDPRKSWMYQTVYDDDVSSDISLISKYYPSSINDTTDPIPVSISSVSYAMRLSEAYLLEAEAIESSGGSMTEAKDLLTHILQSAGYSEFSQLDNISTNEDLKLFTIEEEMKNFVCEAGQDWFAVRRLPFDKVQQLLPTIRSKTLLILPIPQSEMNRNSGLTGMQNPGYGN